MAEYPSTPGRVVAGIGWHDLGPELDRDVAYRHVTDTMQRTLTKLAAEHRFPILG
ncbi:hypothetical protein [Nocardia vinacea]|uniref:hypothetical protein n=1 Tax=Nocardia vinacea TaxID=96468 RepID=UPI00031210D6|nr:hypothetical protein [Nocardia vinacea]